MFASFMKPESVVSDTVTWADAMDFCWFKRQMCNSWTARTPGTCSPLDAVKLKCWFETTYLLDIVLHVVRIHADGYAFEEDGTALPDCNTKVSKYITWSG